jgi:tetratricopeptide (TPR) repeat protein/tRNA A-37 threonylcarbamoyl transferase component Bud32
MSSPAFSIGEVLGHYRIVEQIGAGGMGVVYRAQDERLQRDVAIKVLAAGTLADDAARKRFRKEALTLSRLNHPNIATVFDFDTQNGTDFLVTEFISGVTLDTKLARLALPEKETVSLAIQLSQGLEAAHQSGIIHGDLKPSNLQITSDARLKILDFGLARWMPHASELGLTVTMTETHEHMGTLAYMAPEQFRGASPDVRSDIWGAGAVIYEMATGKRPFIEPTGPQLVNAILSKEPASPKSLNRQVSAGLEKIILRALEKDPSRRYQSFGALTADLQKIEAGLSPAAPAASARRTVIALTVLLAVALGVTGYLAFRRSESAKHAVGTSGTRRSVAVFGFKNLAGRPDKAWVSTAIPFLLTTELAAGEQLRTVPGESVALVKANLSLPDADSYTPETLDKIHRQTSADDIVLGSYLYLGTESESRVRIDVKLQDASAGETIAAISEEGTELQAVVSRAAAKLREKLGADAINPAQAAEANAAIPTTADALRFYSEGLAKLRVFDGPSAVQLLQKAVMADPRNALAHAALSEAWEFIEKREEAKEEAKKAFSESTGLSRESRLWIEARYREANNEGDKAQKIYKTLFGLYPDNLEYGLKLAQGQKEDEALETLQRLRKLPPPAGDDPRIDLQEAMSGWNKTPDHALAAAERAEQKADALGARFMAARALQQQAMLYLLQGQPANAERAGKQAKQIYAALGDHREILLVNSALAGAAGMQGNKTEARKLSDENSGIRHELGLDTKPGWKVDAELRTAGELASAGDFAAALTCYQEALEMARNGDHREKDYSYNWQQEMILEGMGRMELELGNIANANKYFDQSLALTRAMGEGVLSYALVMRSGRMLDQGDLKEARRSLQEALGIATRTHDKNMRASVFDSFGDLSLEEDQLDQAARQYGQALAIRAELGKAEEVAGIRLDLGIVAIEQGDPKKAESVAREALELARKDSYVPGARSAQTVLAGALFAQGRYSEAAKEIEDTESIRQKQNTHRPDYDILILQARIDTALNKTEQAEKSLNDVISATTKTGRVRYAFMARLALGEYEVKSGKATQGRARLAALQKDAKAKGFNLIARKAGAAAKA